MKKVYYRMPGLVIGIACTLLLSGCISWFIPSTLKVVTYVEKDKPVTLSDSGFSVKITSLAIVPSNGTYIMTSVVENNSGKEASFNPEKVELDGVDTGMSYLPPMKGKFDQSVVIGAGKRIPLNMSFQGEAGKDAAKKVKVTLGKASVELEGKQQ